MLRERQFFGHEKVGSSGHKKDGGHLAHNEAQFELGMCTAASFFMSQTVHRSVTTKIVLLDMFLRCDTKNIRKITLLTGIVFVGECRSAKEPKDTFTGSSQW